MYQELVRRFKTLLRFKDTNSEKLEQYSLRIELESSIVILLLQYLINLTFRLWQGIRQSTDRWIL